MRSSSRSRYVWDVGLEKFGAALERIDCRLLILSKVSCVLDPLQGSPHLAHLLKDVGGLDIGSLRVSFNDPVWGSRGRRHTTRGCRAPIASASKFSEDLQDPKTRNLLPSSEENVQDDTLSQWSRTVKEHADSGFREKARKGARVS